MRSMQKMKCPDDNTILSEKTKCGFTVSQCPCCGGLWLPLRSLPDQSGLKSPPAGRRLRCPECMRVMKSKTYRGYSALICDACQHAWVQKGTIELLQMNSKHGTTASDVASVVLDIAAFDPVATFQLAAAGAETLAHAASTVGEAMVDFFVELISAAP